MEAEKPLAVVTGSSRGIGQEIVFALALHFDLLGNHVSTSDAKEKRQQEIIAHVEGLGGRMRSVTADIVTREGRKSLLDEAISTHQGRIAVLCLNAAGGLEEDKGEYYAREINTTSQLDLVAEFLPHLSPGGSMIYLTSIFAHGFLPDDVNNFRMFKQPPMYSLVASTKYETERQLLAESKNWERGVKLGIVVGQAIKGTGAYTMFKRYFPDRLALMERYCEGGVFPEASDMGAAVKDLAVSDYPSGKTVFVGGNQAELAEPQAFEAYSLDRREIAKLLPMYGESTLKADEFISPLGSKLFGTTRYQIRLRDVRGHFTGRFRQFKVEKGVDLSEIGAQALGLTYLGLEPQQPGEFLAFFGEHHSKYLQIVFPGEVVTSRAEITGLNAKGILGRCEMSVEGRGGDEIKVAEMRGVRLAIVPSIELARKIYEKQLAERSLNSIV